MRYFPIHRQRVSSFFAVFALLFGLLLTGCDEAVLGPTLRGSIEGQVLDYEDGTPVAGVSVTTSPATGAFVTDEEGAFLIADVESGPYNITVRKRGFDANTLSVAVRDDETTPATIFLERDGETASADSLTAEIVNWSNRTAGNDTTFVDVEYRVQNPGLNEVTTYEVYIRIATDGNPFFREVRGENLQPDQVDVGTFSKNLRGKTAQSVEIDDIWFETQGE